MNKTKIRTVTVAALTLVLALVLSFAIGSLSVFRRAKAVEYRPGELFSQEGEGTVDASEIGEEGTAYVQFTFPNPDAAVYYRHDLALKWIAPAAAEGEGSADHRAEHFSMTLSFPEINFTQFTVEFQSAEENVTKGGNAVNRLIFLYENNVLKAGIRNASEQPKKDAEGEDTWLADLKEDNAAFAAKFVTVDEADEYEIALSDDTGLEACAAGEFVLTVNGVSVGKVTNIGANYFEYISSGSSNPRDPLTFKANVLQEGTDVAQKVVIKELNGQSFALTAENRLTDNAAPVLVVNEAIYSYKLGSRWSLTYEAIDVCDTSVSVTRRYAMVGKGTAAEGEETVKYPMPLDDDYSALSTSTVFVPTSDDLEEANETQYVSIYFELDDGRTLTGAEKRASRIYLTWYAEEDAVAALPAENVWECPSCGYRIDAEAYEALADDWTCSNPDKLEDHPAAKKADLKEVTPADFGAIVVSRKQAGPSYIGLVADKESLSNIPDPELPAGDALRRADEYQAAVDAASKDLSAGDGAYFYLPSLRDLIASDYADYRNLRFSVYYKKQSMETDASASSATSLRYNALRFEVDEEGKYLFKILASDASSNVMQYYVDGKLENVTSSNIWDIEEIPVFSFTATYSGATIEDPGEQSLGYCESTYTVSSFDIIALDGYETSYKLYRYDGNAAAEGAERPTSYSDLVKNTKSYLDSLGAEVFKPIDVYNDAVTEDDEERWDRTDNKYHWNPDSSLSFMPQEATYYVVECTVTEARLPGYSKTAYQVISVRNQLDSRPDPISWLENNVTSVVLFSISAVLLIVIVVLAVVKPSEKNVEEIDLESLKGKKNKNKK